jgi:hypothetical protein
VSWVPVVVLPNIDFLCSVEGRYAAIVGPSDDRIAALCSTHPTFREFTSRFTDPFGRPQRPSVLLLDDQGPEIYRHGRAVSGFRDLLAMSAIPYKRALAILSPRTTLEPFFANCYDFYPWMLDRHYEYVMAQTPAMSALDQLDDFRGQTSPDVPHRSLDQIDQPLLARLLELWESRYGTENPTWSDRALFRSLNMATHAARMPFNTAGTFYDTGRLVALWISAFEILVHPGTGEANQRTVLRMLDRYPSGISTAVRNVHRCPTLREWALAQMYEARNDYLHGNPVEDDRLMRPNTTYDISAYAALLYRLILTEFLGLHHEPIFASGASDADQVRAILSSNSLNRFQRKIEEALYTMTGHRRF